MFLYSNRWPAKCDKKEERGIRGTAEWVGDTYIRITFHNLLEIVSKEIQGKLLFIV